MSVIEGTRETRLTRQNESSFYGIHRTVNGPSQIMLICNTNTALLLFQVRSNAAVQCALTSYSMSLVNACFAFSVEL